MITLSILICHLYSREKELDRLKAILVPQIQGVDEVEVVIMCDEREMSIGQKRLALINKARGKYCCFVDDDDEVVSDYVQKVLAALQSEPDCCGIEGTMKSSLGTHTFKHSIQFSGWYTSDGIFYRTPNHLNPIKTSIAKMVGFEPVSFGEDKTFSERVLRFLKTEVYIKEPIYIYNNRL